MELQELNTITRSFQDRKVKMPVLFIGHGHPVNAVLDNDFTRSLTRLGQSVEKPNAILVISAHWETVGTYVGVHQQPRTIYDFGNFDERLYHCSYLPPGAPGAARELKKMVSLTDIMEDAGMGLDHGAWTILKFISPEADVPVFEMSLDFTQPPEFHYQLGRQLKALRKKGILIVCSGNIVHNLRMTSWRDIDAQPYDWAMEFDHLVKHHIDHHQFESLVAYKKLGNAAALSIPTNDHYLPMLYCLGMIDKNEPITYLYEGYQFASMSMRCFQAG